MAKQISLSPSKKSWISLSREDESCKSISTQGFQTHSNKSSATPISSSSFKAGDSAHQNITNSLTFQLPSLRTAAQLSCSRVVTLDHRKGLVKRKCLCYNCLSKGHRVNSCRYVAACCKYSKSKKYIYKNNTPHLNTSNIFAFTSSSGYPQSLQKNATWWSHGC